MTAQGKVSPDKGEAARAEVNGNGKPKQITWNGVKLDLPKNLPGTVLWDFAALGGTQGLEQLRGATELVRSVVGDVQNQQIKDTVREKGWSIDQTVEKLLDDQSGLLAKIMDKYNMTPGESEASQKS